MTNYYHQDHIVFDQLLINYNKNKISNGLINREVEAISSFELLSNSQRFSASKGQF